MRLNKITLFNVGIILVLLAVLMVTVGRESRHFQSMDYLESKPKDITGISIEQGTKTLELSKHDNGWFLKGHNQMPVNIELIDKLLSSLYSLHYGKPITSNVEDQLEFEVSPHRFLRKISLYSADLLVDEVFIGTIPSAGKSHVRFKDKTQIYALNLDPYTPSILASYWLNRNCLQIGPPHWIIGDDFTIFDTIHGWKFYTGVSYANERRSVNQYRSEKIVDQFEKLQVESWINKSIDKADFELTTEKDGISRVYRFQFRDGLYLVSRNDINGAFSIDKTQFVNFKNIDFAYLLFSE